MDQERGGTDSGEPRGDSRRAEMAHAYLRYLTLIAVTVTIGCILLAAVLSPEFAWRENALSNLGVTWTDAGTTTTAMLFNGGLVTGGTIGVIVTVSGLRWSTRRDDQAVLTLAGAALALMGLVGVFHQGEMLHFPVAISFFLLVSLTLWVDGGLLYRAGERRRGLVVAAAGTANIAVWVVWFAAVENPSEALAIPELVGALVFGGWLAATAFRLFDSRE